MTKSDISYTTIATAEPLVDGFAIGPSSHAVTVIMDETPSSATTPQKSPDGKGMDRSAKAYAPESNIALGGSRKPLQLSMCPQCSQTHVRTSTKTYPSPVTWVGVVVGAIICFPLCWIPLVIDPMKQTDHYCQSCGKKVGTVKALEGCFVKERV